MSHIDLKKILLISSISFVTAFGLAACGDNDKAKAPAAVEKSAEDATPAESTVTDDVKTMATEKAGEVIEDAKAKATEAADTAKQAAIDDAKKKAEEELKKNMPQ